MSQKTYDKFKDLLTKFPKNISKNVGNYDKNIFGIAGYPHYENVISNILAFFFNSTEEHQLKDLWIKSLYECYCIKNSDEEQLKVEDIGYIITDYVGREVLTEDNKRLDLIVTTAGRLESVFTIENKIFALPDNPWKSYSNYIKEKYSEQEYKHYKILLTIRKEGNKEQDFINITYNELLNKVEKNMGHYVLEANEKWLIVMKELMRNIYELEGVMGNIDADWNTFIVDNQSDIVRFMANYNKDIEAKVEVLKQASENLNEKLYSEEFRGLTTYIYPKTQPGNNTTPFVSVVLDFPTIGEQRNGNLVYESSFVKFPNLLEENDERKLGYLYLAIWYRKNGKGDRDGNKIIKEVKKTLEELEEEKVWEAFNKKEITIKEAKSGDWGNYILVGEEMKFGNGDNTSFINSFINKSVIIIAEVMKVVYGKNSKEE